MARVDYLALGNPTLDSRPSGSTAPDSTAPDSTVLGGTVLGGTALGGSAVYAALQAARLGLRSAIVGRGSWPRLEPYWRPYAAQVRLLLEPAQDMTEFRNIPAGGDRQQWLLKWAGSISQTAELPPSGILHLAPVARELPAGLLSGQIRSDLVCLTPQGLIRRWPDGGGPVRLTAISCPDRLAEVASLVVVADAEARHTMPLLLAVARRGGICVVTKGAAGCEILTSHGWQRTPAEPAVSVADDTGAGDCFAAALAVELYRGATVTAAIRLALCAAAMSVEGEGVTAIAARAQITERLARR